MQVLDDIEFDEKMRIKKIAEGWLWNENLLYDIFYSHTLTANRVMGCSFRTGQGRIEYNAKFTSRHDDRQLAELLKIEVMRIILKHPYTRRREEIRDDASVCASDVTIVQNCKIGDVGTGEIMTADAFKIPKGYCYEEYCKILTQLFSTLPPSESAEMSKINGSSVDNENPSDQNDPSENSNPQNNNQNQESDDKSQNAENLQDSQNNGTQNEQNSQTGGSQNNQNQLQAVSENAKERSELWEDDPVMEETLQEQIEKNYREKSCGSVPGNIIAQLLATEKPKLHYKRILSQFRATLLADKKILTRMRPSRRYGFTQMGSRYDYTTNILVAVDTSGSISDRDLKRFYSAINMFFKNGVKKLDVIQFDEVIQGEVQSLKKASPAIKVKGRGGTSFQPAYDYCAKHKEYNGLIFFTDGYAFEPIVPDTFKAKVVWIMDNEDNYNANSWLKKFGFTTYFEESR